MPRIMKKTPLSEFDLAVLRDRGVSVETACRNRLHTKDDALVIPFGDVHGVYNCYQLLRPHKPPIIKGKARKYVAPTGESTPIYVPAESRGKLLDPSVAFVVTEGPLKALALAQRGHAAIGVTGVFNWKLKGKQELHPSFAAVPMTGRIVYVIFDYDPKPETRRYVYGALRQLAAALRKAGAKEVYDVKLPPGPDGVKQGIDDFLVAHGDEALLALVEQAGPVPSSLIVPLTLPSGRTDAMNARRFATRFGDVLRWVGPWDKWLCWDDQRWRIDDARHVESLAKEVAADLWAEIGAAVAEGKDGLDKKLINAMHSFGRASNSAKGIGDTLALARTEPGVPIRTSELDGEPWLLNVENGTIDLRTGQLKEHRREDYLTKLAPVRFDPAAQCPTWIAFLRRIFKCRDELVDYMQRLTGYSLTGVTEEHLLPFLYGTGANGKSTMMETLLKLLGPDYAMKAAPDLLMNKQVGSHPTERADLHGKRLVACVETEQGRRMAEAYVKELTGGDTVRARRMREDFWEFTPTHHVWLASNYKPPITGRDHGIWRRIKLIPFEVIIPDAEQDKKLPAKLEAELSGILNWALAGCLDWQRAGMREPACVRAATEDYAAEEDVIGQFIDEYCEIGAEFETPATELFNAFKKATDGNITQTMFGMRLTEKGFADKQITSGPNKGRRGRKGLRLREGAK
jgi:putative DNA primase/helicase